MLALAATCVWLGTWQMQRLAEKEALIAAVDTRLDAPPDPRAAAATVGRALISRRSTSSRSR